MNTPLEHHLHQTDRALWADYCRLTRAGLRQQALVALDQFVERLVTYPAEQRHAWVVAFCQAMLDQGEPCPVQVPLLVRVLLPELRLGHEQRRPGYARWIAHLARHIDASRQPSLRALGLRDFAAEDFLREALRLEPDDEVARRLLIDLLADRFRFYVHEVPSGVLAKSDVFRAELQEFEQLASAAGVRARYAVEMATWRFHCEAWEDYLSRRAEFASYAEYLSAVRQA